MKEERGGVPALRDVGLVALAAALLYTAVAAAWLLAAEIAVRAVAPTLEWQLRLQTVDRWFFVVGTAALLYFVLRRALAGHVLAVEEIRSAQERLVRKVERTPLALIEWDEDLRVQRWSENAEILFGWTASEAEGRRWLDWELVHPDEREALQRFLEGLGSRAPGGALLVQRNRHRNGEDIWCEWYVSWLRDAGGNLRSVLALVNDITPDREAMGRMQEWNRDLEVRVARRTRELAAARRDLRAFTNSLANDLRSPVQAVIGFAEDLRNTVGSELPPESRRQLVYLMAAGRQLDHLIEDLLEYARLGTRETVRTPVELVQVARGAIRSLEDRFPEAGSAISLPRSAVTLMADPELLEAVLVNLFENALLYRDPQRPPRITIHVGWTEHEAKVRVQDNGPGIAPEQRERVFRLFERLHSRESHPGSGMGLAVVRKAMDLMGGTVSIEEHAGPGASFLLRFPTAGDLVPPAGSEAADGTREPAGDAGEDAQGPRTGGPRTAENAEEGSDGSPPERNDEGASHTLRP
jgi:PAS domain S-box-containing protein